MKRSPGRSRGRERGRTGSLRVLALLPLLAVMSLGCDILTSEVGYGDEFELEKGSRALVGNEALVTFVRVETDSRCPERVTCLWEGDAAVLLELKRSGMSPKRFVLHTNERFTRDTVVDGITVELLRLDPYPEESLPIPQDDYRATLRLRN